VPGDRRVADLPGQRRVRVVAGTLLQVAESTPILGIEMIATASPVGGAINGASVVVGPSPTVVGGCVVTGAAATSAWNCFFSVCCARASAMPVPQSW
jgi:hypothetical protein